MHSFYNGAVSLKVANFIFSDLTMRFIFLIEAIQFCTIDNEFSNFKTLLIFKITMYFYKA